MNQFDREEQAIIEAEERGEISRAECQRELTDLNREYMQSARDSAQEAYERELERW